MGRLGTALWLVLAAAGSAVAADTARGRTESTMSALERLKADYRRPLDIPDSADNPSTAAKVELGRNLFFDPRLSSSGVISCASCHNPGLGWEDGLPVGRGNMGGQLPRHSPTILNLAWGGPYFWDGRAATLEDQAKGPIAAEGEMAMPHDRAVERISGISGYGRLFELAFPGKPVSIDAIAGAIAAYERTVVSGEAPFDRWISGDETAISEDAKRGFVLFNTKARCATCHTGWRFTDDGFHDIGLPSSTDLGRGALVPGVTILQRAFKTPTLRNIDQRGPYMHDGSLATLEAVVAYYDGGFEKRASLSPDMAAPNLAPDERVAVVAFLKTLSSEDRPTAIPALPQ